jgi:hypothetical protein
MPLRSQVRGGDPGVAFDQPQRLELAGTERAHIEAFSPTAHWLAKCARPAR